MQNSKSNRALIFLLVVVGFLATGCATSRGRVVKTGAMNDCIPAKQSSYRIRGTDTTGVLTVVQKQKLQARTRSWRWPTNEVAITSGFGTRGKEHHDGIDLRAHTGTPVQAAADGKIIYSGSKIRGYGRMVVIRHEGRLSTIYAHNSQLFVSAGQNVRRGQRIALSGNTGRSSGPHVHFEVREGVTAIDPLILMPSPAVANEANRRIASGTRRASPVRLRRRPDRFSQSSSRRAASAEPAARIAEGDGFVPRSRRTAKSLTVN